MGGMFQVLAVLDSGLDYLGAQHTQVVVHIFIERLVGPSQVEAGREDGMRAVGWVRGRSSVGEDVAVERVKVENDQRVFIVLAKPVTPGLCHINIRSIIHRGMIHGRRRRDCSPGDGRLRPSEQARSSATRARRRSRHFKRRVSRRLHATLDKCIHRSRIGGGRVITKSMKVPSTKVFREFGRFSRSS